MAVGALVTAAFVEVGATSVGVSVGRSSDGPSGALQRFLSTGVRIEAAMNNNASRMLAPTIRRPSRLEEWMRGE